MKLLLRYSSIIMVALCICSNGFASDEDNIIKDNNNRADSIKTLQTEGMQEDQDIGNLNDDSNLDLDNLNVNPEPSEQTKAPAFQAKEIKSPYSKYKRKLIYANDVPTDQQVVIETVLFTIVIRLFDIQQPKSTQFFKKLVNDKYYNKLSFYRILQDYIIQAGGSSAYVGSNSNVEDEYNPNIYFSKGLVLLSNLGEPNTSTGQFFITIHEAPWLRNKYNALGRVIYNFNYIYRLSTVDGKFFSKDNNGYLKDPIIITNAQILTDFLKSKSAKENYSISSLPLKQLLNITLPSFAQSKSFELNYYLKNKIPYILDNNENLNPRIAKTYKDITKLIDNSNNTSKLFKFLNIPTIVKRNKAQEALNNEIPIDDETIYVDEDGNEIPADEAGEDVVYVDEDGNEIPADEAEEDVVYVDEDGNEIPADEAEEDVVYVDEDGNEIPADEAEEDVVYVDENGNEIPADEAE